MKLLKPSEWTQASKISKNSEYGLIGKGTAKPSPGVNVASGYFNYDYENVKADTGPISSRDIVFSTHKNSVKQRDRVHGKRNKKRV